MPIARTTTPAGAKIRSPANAADRASEAISAASCDSSARRPRIVSSAPPPIQITANPTCTVLNATYQLDDEEMKTIATARNAAAISAVGTSEACRAAGVLATDVFSMGSDVSGYHHGLQAVRTAPREAKDLELHAVSTDVKVTRSSFQA